jgi:outer membrane protein TolC
MPDNRHIRAAALAALALVSPLQAQSPGATDTLRLSLHEAVATALAAGEEVQVARARRQVTEGQVIQARSGAYPQLSGGFGYTRTLASLFAGLDLSGFGNDNGDENGENPFANLPFGRPNIWGANLHLSQPLYSGGRVSTGLRVARLAREAADLDILEAEADLTHQVRSAYFQAVLAGELVRIAEEAHALASAQLRQVELFQAQGVASEFDLLRARVERDNVEPTLVEARNARRLAELNLKRLLNLPASRPVALTTRLAAELAEIDREALRRGATGRPALRALDAVVAAREGAAHYARTERLPSVNLNGAFAWQAFPEPVQPFNTPWRRDWTVAVQASVPIFNGFRTRGAIQEADGELRAAELQRDQAREGIVLELEAALGDFDAARAQIDARRGTVLEARRALELAELRFANGLATQLEVSSTRLLLEQARVNEAQALHAYVTALSQLERVSGGAVPLLATLLPDPR